MKKKNFYLITGILIIISVLSFFNPNHVLSAFAKSEPINTKELFFSDPVTNERVQELEMCTDQDLLVELTSQNKKIEKADIQIPDGLVIDLEQSKKMLEEKYPQIKNDGEMYVVDEDQLSVYFKNEHSYISTIPIIFCVGVDFKENNLQKDLSALATIEEENYQSPLVKLTVLNTNIELIKPLAGDLNVDLHLDAVQSTIEAGADGIFKLNFKVTGGQKNYKDAIIAVELPDNASFEQALEDVSVAGIVPTYDTENNRLTYFFEELKSGVSFTQLFKVKTENGLVANGTSLSASAEFKAPEFYEKTQTQATISVNSSVNLTANKEYSRTYDSVGIEREEVPQPGDLGVWQVRVNIPKKERGQIYLKEESKIVVKDQLPREMTYVDDTLGGKYNASDHTVTWEFDVPTLEEQKLATTELFSIDFFISTKFPSMVKTVETYTNNVTVSLIDLNENKVSQSSSATVTMFPSIGSTFPPVNGTLLYPAHYGPLNGKADISNDAANANPNPSVYDSASLGFTFQTVPMKADSPSKPFESYDVTYKIDSYLNLKYFYLSQPHYAPNYTYHENGLGRYLPDSAAQMQVFGTINGKEKLLFTNPESKVYHNLADLGITDHISYLRIHYTYRAAGVGQSVGTKFSIEEGYTGQVKNSFGFKFTGFDKNANRVSQEQIAGGKAIWQYSEDRTANVVQAPSNNSQPIVSSKVEFEKEENGVVLSGPNRIKGSLKNDPSSLVNVTSPFETYILLPAGVHLDREKTEEKFTISNSWLNNSEREINGKMILKDKNYLGKKQELIQITWDQESLVANEMLTYSFATTIDHDASSFLWPESFSFIGNKQFKVPESAGNSATDSIIESDTNDLTGNGDRNQQLIKTANQYYLASSSGIITKELVKGDLDEEFSLFGHTTLDGMIHYRFDLTNKGSNKLSTLTLMNVLPSVGDLGITDNEPLNSQFTPLMVGPIQLPNEWASKVNVYYSQSKNPSRKDLIKDVNYPSSSRPIEDPADAEEPKWMTEDEINNWQDIHSFMIQMKPGELWEVSETMTLDFDMRAPEILDKALINPEISEYERATWNSFAYTVNGLQPTEPSKVGVVVNNIFDLKLIKEDDQENEKKLPDTEFTLYDQEKKVLDKQLTDQEGAIYFMDLAPGTYYLKETKAQPNYELNGKMYEVVIKSNGEISITNQDHFIKKIENANDENQLTVVFSNRLKRMPNTGSKNLMLFFVCGFGLMGMSFIYNLKRNQEKGWYENERK